MKFMHLTPQQQIIVRVVVVAERLRRWTRNPLGSPRAGSNPADNDILFHFELKEAYC